MKILEIYLKEDEDFYDYGTANVNGSDIFDVNKVGMSFYDQFISDPEYMEKNKNLKADIVQMSPTEYFKECAKIFGTSFEKQINQIKAVPKELDYLKEVITKYKKKFPITFLNYAEETQEGRHRMFVAGDLFGWDTKFPVMVINWADEEKHKRDEELRNRRDIEQKLHLIERDTKEYRYGNIDEVLIQIDWMAARYLGEENADKLKVKVNDETIELNYNGVDYDIYIDELRIEDIEDDDDFNDELDDLTDEELEDLISKYT